MKNSNKKYLKRSLNSVKNIVHDAGPELHGERGAGPVDGVPDRKTGSFLVHLEKEGESLSGPTLKEWGRRLGVLPRLTWIVAVSPSNRMISPMSLSAPTLQSSYMAAPNIFSPMTTGPDTFKTLPTSCSFKSRSIVASFSVSLSLSFALSVPWIELPSDR